VRLRQEATERTLCLIMCGEPSRAAGKVCRTEKLSRCQPDKSSWTMVPCPFWANGGHPQNCLIYFMMPAGEEIIIRTSEDIPGVLTLQEANLAHNGGNLSVRFSADWFERAVDEKSLVVCRRGGKIVGYVLGTSFGLQDPVAIIQSMLRASPAPADCYLYGSICVAEAERGKGLANAMFKN